MPSHILITGGYTGEQIFSNINKHTSAKHIYINPYNTACLFFFFTVETEAKRLFVICSNPHSEEELKPVF